MGGDGPGAEEALDEPELVAEVVHHHQVVQGRVAPEGVLLVPVSGGEGAGPGVEVGVEEADLGGGELQQVVEDALDAQGAPRK